MIYVAGGHRNEACAGHRWLIQQHVEFGNMASSDSGWNLILYQKEANSFMVYVSKWICIFFSAAMFNYHTAAYKCEFHGIPKDE